MKKIILASLVLLFTAAGYAQQAAPGKEVKSTVIEKQPPAVVKPPAKPVKEIDPEIKELMVARDTAKSELRVKTLENKKDMNHYDRMWNNNKTWKEQLKTAKKAKKTEKEDALSEKVSLTTDSLKELDTKLKSDKKEISTLQKNLDKAEVDLEKAKERIAKEKSKGKK